MQSKGNSDHALRICLGRCQLMPGRCQLMPELPELMPGRCQLMPELPELMPGAVPADAGDGSRAKP